MEQNWKSVKAVVTGASRGLGLALARAVARRGGQVVMVSRGQRELAEAADELTAEGLTAYPVQADVGEPGAAASIAARASELLGDVNLLIHNASTLGPVPLRALSELTPHALSDVFQVNALGPQRLTNALLGTMRRHGRATVVAISSDAAVEAYPAWGAYGASKAAFDHLIRVQAAELNDTGIRLISLDPGEMDTQMHAAAMPGADPATLSQPAEVADRIIARLGREFDSGLREVV